MIIVWDESKRASNIAKHDLDFADLDNEFFLNAHIVPTHSGRYLAIAKLVDRTIVAVFSVLGKEGVSVISMRRASRKERKLIDG